MLFVFGRLLGLKQCINLANKNSNSKRTNFAHQLVIRIGYKANLNA
jgi:hypothetical protein